jgi:two-component system sensor histidine kinase KdpD
MSNYFRPGNLGALRELALLWVADRVEESLSTYLIAHGIGKTWEARSESSSASPADVAATC